MVELSENTMKFVQEVFPAIVATRWPSGSVHTNPVWFEYEDGYFWLNTMRGSKWLENIKREGEVTLALVDPQNMYRWAEVRGKLVNATEEGGQEHIDKLSMRYRGQSYDRSYMPDQVRVKIQIEPVKVKSSLDQVWGRRSSDGD
jgi:PPOX class probable F420-dependent enzyme